MTPAPWNQVLGAEERPPTLVVLPNASRTVAVPTVRRHETRWLGDLPQTLGAVPGKPALAFRGRPLYPEFVLLRLLEEAGWSGVWVNNWRGGVLWIDINTPAPVPPAPAEALRSIEERAGTRRGCWDILAWRGDEVLFVESKQRSSDRISPGQAVWLEQAIGCGVATSSFLIAEYTLDRRR